MKMQIYVERHGILRLIWVKKICDNPSHPQFRSQFSREQINYYYDSWNFKGKAAEIYLFFLR